VGPGPGLIGDSGSWALAGPDGTITRLSVPALGQVFGEDHTFAVAPEHVLGSRQYHLAGTGVLVTELRCPTGLVEITDAVTLPSGADLTEDVRVLRGELLRYVRVLEGHAAFQVRMNPRIGGVSLHTSHPSPHLARAGEDLWFLLRWGRTRRLHHVHPRRLLANTTAAWRTWSAGITYDGPQAEAVRRSAVTLKLLHHTASHNAADTAFALRRIGLTADAEHILGSVLDTIEEHTPAEVLDCVFQWVNTGGPIDDSLWRQLTTLVRSPDTKVTFELAEAQIAHDRIARIAGRLGLAESWSAEAAALRDRILTEAWDESRQSLTAQLGPGHEPDPRLLTLPLRRVLPADHPRMTATARAVPAREAPYGFWLADNLLGQGRIEQAGRLFGTLCAAPLPDLPGHTALISSGIALDRALRGGRPDLAVANWTARSARLPEPGNEEASTVAEEAPCRDAPTRPNIAVNET
jgi:hypothetical protein